MAELMLTSQLREGAMGGVKSQELKMGDLSMDAFQVDDLKSSVPQPVFKDRPAPLQELQTKNISHEDGASWPFSAASTEFCDSPGVTKSPFPLKSIKSFSSHRQGMNSGESSPQHLRKSVVTPLIRTDSTCSSLSPLSAPPGQGLPSQLHLPDATLSSLQTPPTARFSSLQSPCFFHQGFGDAINLDRVLEEVAAESEGMSHSRLLQTATSVREISKQLSRRPIRRAVRTIMIVTKARDNSLVPLTRDLAEWLMTTPRYHSDVGVTVYVDAKLKTSKRFDAEGLLARDARFATMLHYWDADLCWSNPELFDLVLTLGGDGTVLFTSCLFQRIVPPILAFSLGSLGFLTNFPFPSYQSSLNTVLGEAGMRVNLRMRFTCTIFRAHLDRRESGGTRRTRASPVDTDAMIEGERFEVLNELVIDRGPSPYVSNLELYGDGELLTVVQADGCIFSTPTGSTAYSLSAGGSLVHPSIPGILLSPICPHTLSFRPMVLSDSLRLHVCLPRTSRSTAYASFDGKGRVELRRGDCVQVEAGRYPFPTVVGAGGTGGEWFESVRRALRWNTRGAVQKGFSARDDHKAAVATMAAGDGALAEGDKQVEERDDEYDDEEHCEEEEEWDINPDPVHIPSANDSGVGASVVSSANASPVVGTKSVVGDGLVSGS